MSKGEDATEFAAVEPEALRSLVSRLFAGVGMRADDASIVAGLLVESDLRGVRSHGTAMSTLYLKALEEGRIDPRGRPWIAVESDAFAVVDGDNAMGHIGASAAMQQAIVRASSCGVGVVALRHSNHCGALRSYTQLALQSQMVGMAFATSVPTMAPAGGVERLVGMNPLAIAVPGRDSPPFELDMGFAAAARGRIVEYARRGEPIPTGWATDASGRPTTDAAAALEGLLQPIGDYKGVGLAVGVGLIASMLGGAGMGAELGSLEEGWRHGRDGLLSIAIDPSRFGDSDGYSARVDQALSALRGSQPVAGGQVVLPGDRERECRREHASGIPVDAQTRTAIKGWCEHLGIGHDSIL